MEKASVTLRRLMFICEFKPLSELSDSKTENAADDKHVALVIGVRRIKKNINIEKYHYCQTQGRIGNIHCGAKQGKPCTMTRQCRLQKPFGCQAGTSLPIPNCLVSGYY